MARIHQNPFSHMTISMEVGSPELMYLVKNVIKNQPSILLLCHLEQVASTS